MKIKKCIASVVAAAFCLTMISGTASAHRGDVWDGHYYIVYPATTVDGKPNIVFRDTADFVLRINPSAQNDVFTYSDVYQYGTDWNSTSNNVRLSVIMVNSYTPTRSNEINVDGADLPVNADVMTAGYTLFYNQYGEEVDANEDCVFSLIQINTSNAALDYYRSSTPAIKKSFTKKTFLHEVGHALKLCHPIRDPSYSGHTYNNGYPIAIMNQGKAGYYGYIGKKIEEHDKICVQAKWGV